MKAYVASTDRLTTVNGQRCRIWRAKSEGGVDFEMFVPLVRVLAEADQAEFERELQETPQPAEERGQVGQAFDARMF